MRRPKKKSSGIKRHVQAMARARQLRELMQTNGWNQKQLAEHLQVTPGVVCQLFKRLEKEESR